MRDQELLQAIRKITNEETRVTIKKELEPIKADIDSLKNDVVSIKEDIENLKEDSEITRDGVNSLLPRAEECGNVIKFPLPKIANSK